MLEVIGVEQEQPGAMRVVAQRVGHDLGEVAAVERAGQLVGPRAQLGLRAGSLELAMGVLHLRQRAQQLVLEPSALGDVAHHPVVVEGAIGSHPGPQPVCDDPLAPVEADHPVLEVDRLGRSEPRERRNAPASILGVHERLEAMVAVRTVGQRPAGEGFSVGPAVDGREGRRPDRPGACRGARPWRPPPVTARRGPGPARRACAAVR